MKFLLANLKGLERAVDLSGERVRDLMYCLQEERKRVDELEELLASREEVIVSLKQELDTLKQNHLHYVELQDKQTQKLTRKIAQYKKVLKLNQEAALALL